MEPDQGFLQRIRQRPESSVRRLVYADWLTDRGDPRGEFIRCQVQANRLPKYSPRRVDLESQAHDLLREHEAAWLGSMAGAVAHWEWQGGLLDWITVPAEVFLAHASEWLPAGPLLGVQLRQVGPHVADLARCEQLAHLSALFLGDNKLSDDELDVLLRSPHLRQIQTLYLQSNRLGAAGMKLLAHTPNLPQLRELCLGHNWLGDEGLDHLLASPHLTRLRMLDLTLTAISEAGFRRLLESPLLGRLRTLMIGLNQSLPPGCLTALAGQPALAGLRILGYGMNRHDDAAVTALATSPHATGLRHLALDTYQCLGEGALTALADSTSLKDLRSLTLGCANWGVAGARALGRSRALRRLRSLQMSPAGDDRKAVAQALLGQPLLHRLHQLEVPEECGRAGLRALVRDSRPLRAHRLEVTLSRSMAADWEAFLDRKRLPQLTDLTLYGVPSGCLRALCGAGRLPTLRKLSLHGLPDLDEFQEWLDSDLPGCLHALRIDLDDRKEKQQDLEVVQRLSAVWSRLPLRRLGLMWSLSVEAVRLLTERPFPTRVTELEVGTLRMGAEGMAVLAHSPWLRQLRRLTLRSSSSQTIPGLESLAESPHVSPLLRVDIHNGHVPREILPAIRRRFGGRFAAGGRLWPRTITLGSMSALMGDGED